MFTSFASNDRRTPRIFRTRHHGDFGWLHGHVFARLHHDTCGEKISSVRALSVSKFPPSLCRRLDRVLVNGHSVKRASVSIRKLSFFSETFNIVGYASPHQVGLVSPQLVSFTNILSRMRPPEDQCEGCAFVDTAKKSASCFSEIPTPTLELPQLVRSCMHARRRAVNVNDLGAPVKKLRVWADAPICSEWAIFQKSASSKVLKLVKDGARWRRPLN